MPAESTAKVRPALFEDAQAIDQIHRRNGMDPIQDVASWKARWETYPFYRDFHDIPIGWVLETDEGEIVGSLGNVHMLYEFGGRHLKASIATSWAVDALHRSKAMRLVATFYRQKGVDLFINGSANVTTSKILSGLKIPRMPIPDYATPCFWAVRPTRFARAALQRKSISGAALLAYPAGAALHLRDIVSRSGRGRLSSTISTAASFDSRFDDLWSRVIVGPPRLRAVRTRAALEWRFGAELASKKATVLTAENRALDGYVVLVRRSGMGMDIFDIADLQAAGDKPEIVRDLLLASVQLARQAGADALKFVTGTPIKRIQAMALKPYSYKLPHWPLFSKTADQELEAPLSHADAWDFSLFDTY